MAEDQLRNAIDGMRARLQAELDAQLGSLADTHSQAIGRARQAADEEAESRYATALRAARDELTAQLQTEVASARAEAEAVRAEWSARLQTEMANARLENEAIRDELTATFESDLAAARAESETIRAELGSRLQAEVDAVRAEVGRTMVAEATRARVEAAQAAADSVAQARRELDEALAAERQRAQEQVDAARQQLYAQAQVDIEAERQRAQQQIDAARQQVQVEIDAERRRTQQQIEAANKQADAQARAQIEAERERLDREMAHVRAALAAERASSSESNERARASHSGDDATPPSGHSSNGEPGLLDAIRAVDAAASLSDALAAVVRGAAREAPRAALFMVDGARLQEWPVPGLPSIHSAPIRSEELETGILGEALRRSEPAVTGRGDGASAPAFASLPPGRMAVAVPFVLGGTTVAVLYADEGAAGDAPPAWPDRIQILGRHASAFLASVTAMRTAQALRLLSGPPTGVLPNGAAHDSDQDGAQGARRYARLLVSEIKLYNESAVRTGREQRDLLQRLKPEIERARRLYDERVAASVGSRDAYFHQELVLTLADGDLSLLG